LKNEFRIKPHMRRYCQGVNFKRHTWPVDKFIAALLSWCTERIVSNVEQCCLL